MEPHHPSLGQRRLGAVLVVLCVPMFGCTTFKPVPLEELLFKERAQTQERQGLRVTAAVPSRDESKRAFGIDLAKKGIQPIWVEIENETVVPYTLMLSGVDPAYFSAREAAYKSRLRFRPRANRKIEAHFAAHKIDPFVSPFGRTAGFVFTNRRLGTKEVRIKIYGPRRVRLFEFYLPVPGFRADYHEVDWETVRAQEFANFDDEESFRAALRELPCCTTRRDGSGRGDPLNLVIVGDDEWVATAFVRAGWDETELLTFASAWRTFRAFFGGEYKYSPMSALYVFGRPQDIGLQKARDTIHERNHIRLWLAPLQFRGQDVWVGTITRDIGVYFTRRAWNLTTHAIDPDVDEARRYLREDFAIAQDIDRWGFVEGVGVATPEEPHRNLMNAPWWTDGLRLVVEIAEHPIALEEQGFLYWDWATEDDEQLNGLLRRLSECRERIDEPDTGLDVNQLADRCGIQIERVRRGLRRLR